LDQDLLSTPFRPLPIRVINAIGRGLARLGVVPISLEPESLLEAATKETGLTDFGSDSFMPGFRKLLESVETDAHLTLFGRFFARRQILELICHRLQIVDHRKRHPEVADEVIRKPLFILGLPRTGTTLLYGLIAEDPAIRAPLSWEIDDPCPPPETATYETDPRIERCRERFDQVGKLAPRFQAIHPVGALLPQECIVLTASDFMSLRFEMVFRVDRYQAWLLDQDMSATYEYHRRYLQHLQSRHAGERWILKSPGHLGSISALFDTYPDAMVVQTHRDPLRVIPSVANLEFTMRQVASDDVDPIDLGREQLHAWATLLDQNVAARSSHPERESQILDLSMQEVVRDPIACVERIYAHFDLDLSDEARHRMQRYLDAHPRDEFGAHRYSLEAFGLDESVVNDRFKGYRERFGIASEPYAPR
jgi:Sulfotransferase family